MGKRVQKAPGKTALKLKPYERTVEFTSKQMYDDMKLRADVIDEARALVEQMEKRQAELVKLQNEKDEYLGKLKQRMLKVQGRIQGYVEQKFKPLLGETEDTRDVILADGKVIIVVVDKVAELASKLKEEKAKESNKVPEAKK
jgi:hypothetical protein